MLVVCASLCVAACSSNFRSDAVSTLSTQYGFRFSDYGPGDQQRFRARLQEIFPEGSDVPSALQHLQSAAAECRTDKVVVDPEGAVHFVNPSTGLGVPGPVDATRPEAQFYARSREVHHCAVARHIGSGSVIQYGVSFFADTAGKLVRLSAVIGNY